MIHHSYTWTRIKWLCTCTQRPSAQLWCVASHISVSMSEGRRRTSTFAVPQRQCLFRKCPFFFFSHIPSFHWVTFFWMDVQQPACSYTIQITWNGCKVTRMVRCRSETQSGMMWDGSADAACRWVPVAAIGDSCVLHNNHMDLRA